jgi:prepilin-type N-terminal cleavage/methylation domain-containing protein
MHPLDRRGFTLIELMVAIVLMGIVATGIYRVLATNQRTYHAQTQRVELQQNIRAAASILPAEFRELAASEGDIYAMGQTEIRMRAMRQFSALCVAPVLGVGTTNLAVMVFKDLFSGNTFEVGDSILFFYDGDEGSRNDDGWVVGAVKSPPATVACPNGSAAYAFTVDLHPAFPNATQLNRPGAIPNGGPIRGFQSVRYLLHQSPSDGLWYLALDVYVPGSNAWTDPQPLVGPLSGPEGLRFAYYDTLNAQTAFPTNVALIEFAVAARTQDPVKSPGGGTLTTPVERLTTKVALRNNRRW